MPVKQQQRAELCMRAILISKVHDTLRASLDVHFIHCLIYIISKASGGFLPFSQHTNDNHESEPPIPSSLATTTAITSTVVPTQCII